MNSRESVEEEDRWSIQGSNHVGVFQNVAILEKKLWAVLYSYTEEMSRIYLHVSGKAGFSCKGQTNGATEWNSSFATEVDIEEETGL